MMRPDKPRPFDWPQALASLFAITTLSGCVGLGGNIKGSFACQAPDGICAPSAVIDDRALRLISDDPSATPTPAGTYRPEDKPPTAKSMSARVAAVQPVRGPVSTTPGRSNERVLRIVFPAHIDARGRLHEASAVHAVVSQGEWLTSTDDNAAPTRNAMSAAPDMPSLAEALASKKEAAPLEVDPNLPDPALVSAARARKADPVAAIKAEVSERLKPSPRAAAGTAALVASGQAAAAGTAQPEAPAVRPTVRAASFPAAVAEDN
ncbi:Type IV conjugative transfer system lipo family protein [Sphingobium herbicidovorans NBRC 16415]|uniref:Type IV conjugative transfer system lipo family protein n=1 Tax=Sphingobium herbicidovorans (strain ATCC 700291 / DSM 11019 / CCUG 56400 / KCTC 2939 / LMG 18315 / NBRC 16415 / MH) TaxID=1219045 RepID=A0A086PBP5_SPHHM|nr:TraV family lipoprotein [Sphingobium herbicidovorans]KFG90813.1 Type IV conjugative transfer system lipo family protein [Sphingobium herbicidovorans NBRC 16415]